MPVTGHKYSPKLTALSADCQSSLGCPSNARQRPLTKLPDPDATRRHVDNVQDLILADHGEMASGWVKGQRRSVARGGYPRAVSEGNIAENRRGLEGVVDKKVRGGSLDDDENVLA